MKSFVCSLCHNGILGGGLYLDSHSLTYKTNKLTVAEKTEMAIMESKHESQREYYAKTSVKTLVGIAASVLFVLTLCWNNLMPETEAICS